jgi:branched-chain amino acid transport system substrate-binding protein
MNPATSSITRMSLYFVRVSQTVPQDVAPLGPWAVAHGIKRVSTIVSDYAPGYDAEAYFIKTFKAVGGTIVGSARTPQQETNFPAYMERVLEAKPDALYMFQPAGSPSVAFVRAYVERGLKTAGIKLL